MLDRERVEEMFELGIAADKDGQFVIVAAVAGGTLLRANANAEMMMNTIVHMMGKLPTIVKIHTMSYLIDDLGKTLFGKQFSIEDLIKPVMAGKEPPSFASFGAETKDDDTELADDAAEHTDGPGSDHEPSGN